MNNKNYLIFSEDVYMEVPQSAVTGKYKDWNCPILFVKGKWYARLINYLNTEVGIAAADAYVNVRKVPDKTVLYISVQNINLAQLNQLADNHSVDIIGGYEHDGIVIRITLSDKANVEVAEM